MGLRGKGPSRSVPKEISELAGHLQRYPNPGRQTTLECVRRATKSYQNLLFRSSVDQEHLAFFLGASLTSVTAATGAASQTNMFRRFPHLFEAGKGELSLVLRLEDCKRTATATAWTAENSSQHRPTGQQLPLPSTSLWLSSHGDGALFLLPLLTLSANRSRKGGSHRKLRPGSCVVEAVQPCSQPSSCMA